MVGVALMVVTTPLGFSALFTVLGDIITRPIVSLGVWQGEGQGRIKNVDEMCKDSDSYVFMKGSIIE